MSLKKSIDGRVKFYEKSHSYVCGKKKLNSVTKFLGSFGEQFDANKIAKIKAFQSRRAGIKGQGVRYWKEQWKQSSEHGTRVHNLLEEYNLHQFGDRQFGEGTSTLDYEDRDMNKYNQGLVALNTYYKSVGEPFIWPEFIIYDEELQLAGQIDLLVERNGEETERVYDLIDYKTNNEITETSYKNKKMKPPLSDLPDCSYYKYMLQLSMYAYMLEKQGAKIGDLILLHLKEDEYVKYPMKYDKESILKLIVWTDVLHE